MPELAYTMCVTEADAIKSVFVVSKRFFSSDDLLFSSLHRDNLRLDIEAIYSHLSQEETGMKSAISSSRLTQQRHMTFGKQTIGNLINVL